MENQGQNNAVLSIQEWVITLIIAAIPIVGFIMLFVWGFGDGTNVNKANFAKASLIVYAIMLGMVIILYVLIAIVFGAALLGGMSDM